MLTPLGGGAKKISPEERDLLLTCVELGHLFTPLSELVWCEHFTAGFLIVPLLTRTTGNNKKQDTPILIWSIDDKH